ncbi:MAG TPA: hypothetical protein PKJ41_10300 [Bryobacteraceae bacterium]|nr:hypothetical protein [Bryobacteraceae bacterium]HPT27852.1 hypothetical protein [Bryobacteraceae bacterium]
MPLTIRSVALLTLTALAAHASETAALGDGDPNLPFKLVNFAILAAGVGLLFVKVILPAFKKQQKQILDGLNQAQLRAEEAARQAAEIDRRMAGLEQDVASIRQNAQREMESETERFSRETQATIEKLERSTSIEIASMAKAARQELKIYSAGLALDLAKQKIQARLDDSVQSTLVSRFVAGLTPGVVEKN